VTTNFDLSIEKVQVSNTEPTEGEPVTISVTVKNIGNRPSDPFDVWFDQKVELIEPTHASASLPLKIHSNPILPGNMRAFTFIWNATEIFNPINPPLSVWVYSLNDANPTNNLHFIKNVDVIDTSGFEINIDAYSFANYDFTEDAKEMLENNVKEYIIETLISLYPHWPKFVREAISDLIASLVAENLINDGSCYGMAATSCLYYTEYLPRPVDEDVFHMTLEQAANNIIEYQVDQTFPKLKYFLMKIKGIHLSEEYEKIVTSLENDEPIVLFLTSKGSGKIRHAVTVFNVYDVSESIRNIVTYDSNYPSLPTVFSFDLENNRVYQCAYQQEGYEILDAFVSKPILTRDEIWRIVEDFIHEIMRKLKGMLIIKSPVNVEIHDQFGRILSDNICDIPDAYIEYYNFTDTKIFYLPLDLAYEVRIQAYDSGKCSITCIIPLSEEEGIVSRVTFNLTTATEARFELHSDETSYSLQVDENGDGIIDYELQPQTEIIPEFPSFLILSIFIIATLLAVIAFRRRHRIMLT